MTISDNNRKRTVARGWVSQVGTVLLAVAVLVGTAGCFKVEQTLLIEPDLSGRAGFNMTINMEPMVEVMATFARSMSGKSGPPTAAELEKARAEFLAGGMKNMATEQEEDRQLFAKSLPEGVKLLDAKFTDEGLKFSANLLIGFDQLSKLSAITFPKKVAAPGGPPAPGNPVDGPFDDLKVVDEGSTLLITSVASNPAADEAPSADMLDPTMTKTMESMLSDMGMVFKVTAPFAVLETNAHRREGTTLIWEYDAASINKLTPAQRLEGIKVRYQK